MNIYEEIFASWVAFDLVLIAVWHTAHVVARAQRTQPSDVLPTPVVVQTHTVSRPLTPTHLTLAKAS